jgi:hypothetical protein
MGELISSGIFWPAWTMGLGTIVLISIPVFWDQYRRLSSEIRIQGDIFPSAHSSEGLKKHGTGVLSTR